MELNVGKVLRAPNMVEECNVCVDINDMRYLDAPLSFPKGATVAATYKCVGNDGSRIVMEGELQTEVVTQCARCTKTIIVPLAFAFSERFAKCIDEEQDEYYPIVGEVIALDEPVRDNILLNLPLCSVCSEDCKGLCPQCGTDLNVAQCSCTSDDDDAHMSALSKLSQLLNEEV